MHLISHLRALACITTPALIRRPKAIDRLHGSEGLVCKRSAARPVSC